MYALRTRTQKLHIIIYDFISYIKEPGFSIALSFYLLIRIESKLDKITELLQIHIGKRTSYNLIHLSHSLVKAFFSKDKNRFLSVLSDTSNNELFSLGNINRINISTDIFFVLSSFSLDREKQSGALVTI